MLVHRRVTPQQYVAGTHSYTWVEIDNVGQSFLSQETTRWQRLRLEPPTLGTKVQHAILHITHSLTQVINNNNNNNFIAYRK